MAERHSDETPTETEILHWVAGTEVEYVPTGKRQGTASWDRYEKYSKAKTVGEALALGSSLKDLINDYDKKILKVVGGPRREKPLDAKDALLDSSAADEVDRALGQLAKRVQRRSGDLPAELAERSWCESTAMRARRLEAEAEARAVLGEVEAGTGGKVADGQLMQVLRCWAFRKNDGRRTVAPEGKKSVESDCFGVMRNPRGQWAVTTSTKDYPCVTRVLVRWLKDNRPGGINMDFPFTSVHVNSGFAARRHRDIVNAGPTAIRALGSFTGGRLEYWPEDNGAAELDCLPDSAKVALDVHSATALIDGNRAHSVESFEGDRMSLVFFSHESFWKVPQDVRAELGKYGIEVPGEDAVAGVRRIFSSPKGHPSLGLKAAAVKSLFSPGTKREADVPAEGEPEKRAKESPAESPQGQRGETEAPGSPKPGQKSRNQGLGSSGQKLQRERRLLKRAKAGGLLSFLAQSRGEDTAEAAGGGKPGDAQQGDGADAADQADKAQGACDADPRGAADQTDKTDEDDRAGGTDGINRSEEPEASGKLSKTNQTGLSTEPQEERPNANESRAGGQPSDERGNAKEKAAGTPSKGTKREREAHGTAATPLKKGQRKVVKPEDSETPATKPEEDATSLPERSRRRKKPENGKTPATGPEVDAASLAKRSHQKKEEPEDGKTSADGPEADPQKRSHRKKTRPDGPEADANGSQTRKEATAEFPRAATPAEALVQQEEGSPEVAQDRRILTSALRSSKLGEPDAMLLTDYFRLLLDGPEAQLKSALQSCLAPGASGTLPLPPALLAACREEAVKTLHLLSAAQKGPLATGADALRALARASVLTQPSRGEMPARARSWGSEAAKRASLPAMERAVTLAFGECGGSVDTLISALSDGADASAMYSLCAPKCGARLLAMRAVPLGELGAEVALHKASGSAVLLEKQYAGTRVQVHKESKRISIFDEAGSDLAGTLGEWFVDWLLESFRGSQDCILDAVLQQQGSVRLAAFDCLWLGGHALTREPLRERRRALLEAVVPSEVVSVATAQEFSVAEPPSEDAVCDFLRRSVGSGGTGALVKRLEGEYEAGVASPGWLSLKLASRESCQRWGS